MFNRHVRNALIFVAGAALAGCVMEAEEDDLVQATSQALSAPGYIVTLDAGASPRARAAEIAEAHGVAVGFVYEHALQGFSFQGSEQAAQRIAALPGVLMVERDGIATIVAEEMAGKPDGDVSIDAQVVPWGITRVGGARSGVGKTAWIIDTGIDLDHPDLNVDVARSVSFVTKGKNTADDGNGHGTHVAGTVAALDNSIDVIGVAAGAKVVAVRVLDNSGSGTWSGVIAGVDYVAQNASSGDVANMSLGGGANTTLDNAVKSAASKGIKFALAAGNEGNHANNSSPARANGTNIYTVSAIASNDCLTSWSNYGNPPVDYAAPGASILSTKKGGGTTTFSGTSMAAPHVAGLLLVGLRSDGNACGDPDGNADPIAHN
jgi:subtilisin family serine protease